MQTSKILKFYSFVRSRHHRLGFMATGAKRLYKAGLHKSGSCEAVTATLLSLPIKPGHGLLALPRTRFSDHPGW
jgi:hypothetical protein